jgi:hypothetical protein
MHDGRPPRRWWAGAGLRQRGRVLRRRGRQWRCFKRQDDAGRARRTPGSLHVCLRNLWSSCVERLRLIVACGWASRWVGAHHGLGTLNSDGHAQQHRHAQHYQPCAHSNASRRGGVSFRRAACAAPLQHANQALCVGYSGGSWHSGPSPSRSANACASTLTPHASTAALYAACSASVRGGAGALAGLSLPSAVATGAPACSARRTADFSAPGPAGPTILPLATAAARKLAVSRAWIPLSSSSQPSAPASCAAPSSQSA